MKRSEYETGRWVGEIIASVRLGRELSSTWPKEALKEDEEKIKSWAEIHGLRAVFDENGLNVSRPAPPELKVVK